jgi:hypothetical protein
VQRASLEPSQAILEPCKVNWIHPSCATAYDTPAVQHQLFAHPLVVRRGGKIIERRKIRKLTAMSLTA